MEQKSADPENLVLIFEFDEITSLDRQKKPDTYKEIPVELKERSLNIEGDTDYRECDEFSEAHYDPRRYRGRWKQLL